MRSRLAPSTIAYEFANGYRAPPWRQVHGDLAYIIAKPVDSDELTIVANTDGVWVAKKTQADQSAYDRDGDVYPSLVALFKAVSLHFAATIDSQVSAC
jgi:hypothetical protein